jgi:hypothetical protein
MTMLSPLLFAAAVLAGAPDVPPPPAPVEEENRLPAPEEGQGGPYEPIEEVTVLVEARPTEAPRPFTIAPDPELERRYAPREREPLNCVTIPF